MTFERVTATLALALGIAMLTVEGWGFAEIIGVGLMCVSSMLRGPR